MNISKINLVLSFMCITACQKLCGQTFTYKGLPKKYSSINTISNQERVNVKKIFNGAYDVTLSLPSNYVKDGSVDYTSFIQKALDNHSIVTFPNFPVLINPTGLTISTNSKLYFPINSRLVLVPSNRKAYEMIRLHKVRNVMLYFPVIIGDRKKHIDAGGEWGMGISIRDSENILIKNAKVDDCWGDGIYLGQISTTNRSIQIIKPLLNNNRRNGISIIAVDGLKLDRPVISNTNGTSPMAGIDFEPDSNDEIIDNISINNPITFNNGYHGILFALSSQSGKVRRNINITINNPLDDQSAYGISFKLKQTSNLMTPVGSIKIINPVLKYNKVKAFLLYPGNLDNTIKVDISNANIQDRTVAPKSNRLMKIKDELRSSSKNISIQ